MQVAKAITLTPIDHDDSDTTLTPDLPRRRNSVRVVVTKEALGPATRKSKHKASLSWPLMAGPNIIFTNGNGNGTGAQSVVEEKLLPVDKLIVGVDFGTTYSGYATARSSNYGLRNS